MYDRRFPEQATSTGLQRATLRLCANALTILFFLSSATACDRSGKDVVVIGAVVPLTGDAGSFGKNVVQGATLAIEEVNARAGGQRFRLSSEDSRGVATDAVTAARKLLAIDKAKMLIGDVTSAGTHALIPVADEARVPLMSPSASDPSLSGASLYFVRLWPSDVYEASVISRYAKDQRFSKIGIVYANTDYGVAMVSEFTRQSPGGVAFSTGVDRETLDYRSVIQRAVIGNVDALFVVLYPEDARRFLDQLAESGFKVPVLATATVEDPKVLGAVAAERLVFASPVPPLDSEAGRQAFIAAYEKRFGEKPGVLSDIGYDAVKILTQAWSDTRGSGAIAVANAVKAIRGYRGVSGTLTFSSNGDVVKDYRLRTVVNGSFSWLERK